VESGCEHILPWAQNKLNEISNILLKKELAYEKLDKSEVTQEANFDFFGFRRLKVFTKLYTVDGVDVMIKRGPAADLIRLTGLSGVLIVLTGLWHSSGGGTPTLTSSANCYMLFDIHANSDATAMVLVPHYGLPVAATLHEPSDPKFPIYDNPAVRKVGLPAKIGCGDFPMFFPTVTAPPSNGIREIVAGLNNHLLGVDRGYYGYDSPYFDLSSNNTSAFTFAGDGDFGVPDAWEFYLVLGGNELCYKPSYTSKSFSRYVSLYTDLSGSEIRVGPLKNTNDSAWSGVHNTYWPFAESEDICAKIAAYVYAHKGSMSAPYVDASFILNFDTDGVVCGSRYRSTPPFFLLADIFAGTGRDYVPVLYGKNNFTVTVDGLLDHRNISVWRKISDGTYWIRYQDSTDTDAHMVDGVMVLPTWHLGAPVTYLSSTPPHTTDTLYGAVLSGRGVIGTDVVYQTAPYEIVGTGWAGLNALYKGSTLIDSTTSDRNVLIYFLDLDNDHAGKFAILYFKALTTSAGELRLYYKVGDDPVNLLIKTIPLIYMSTDFALFAGSVKLDVNCIIISYNIQASSNKYIGILNLKGADQWIDAPFMKTPEAKWVGDAAYQEWELTLDDNHYAKVGDIVTPWPMWWSTYSLNRLLSSTAVGIVR
jgi:hypothetical protein